MKGGGDRKRIRKVQKFTLTSWHLGLLFFPLFTHVNSSNYLSRLSICLECPFPSTSESFPQKYTSACAELEVWYYEQNLRNEHHPVVTPPSLPRRHLTSLLISFHHFRKALLNLSKLHHGSQWTGFASSTDEMEMKLPIHPYFWDLSFQI